MKIKEVLDVINFVILRFSVPTIANIGYFYWVVRRFLNHGVHFATMESVNVQLTGLFPFELLSIILEAYNWKMAFYRISELKNINIKAHIF